MIEIFGKECKQTIILDLLLSHPYTQYNKYKKENGGFFF